jgi:hypothetical protein
MGSAWATLICYVSMVWVSWYYGEKYFPVNYNWKKMGLWLAAAIGLYVISKVLSFVGINAAIYSVVNTVLFLSYLTALWQIEIKTKKVL